MGIFLVNELCLKLKVLWDTLGSIRIDIRRKILRKFEIKYQTYCQHWLWNEKVLKSAWQTQKDAAE